NELSIAVRRPVTNLGYTFNIGDNVGPDQTKIQTGPAQGGSFAWLYSPYQSERTGTPFESYWNRLPPPLVREGNKVQTPWLTSFLKDPYPIRPAVNLRMPRFHFAWTQEETRDLANYFAARDGAEFPYQDISEREQDYLARLEKDH